MFVLPVSQHRLLNVLHRVLSMLETLGVRKNQARRCWIAEQKNHQPDVYHKALEQSVHNSLKALKLSPESKYILNGISLDLAIPELKLAIVIESPESFTVNSKLPTGTSLFRRRQIRSQGWSVAVVNIYKWETFTVRAKNTFLSNAIAAQMKEGWTLKSKDSVGGGTAENGPEIERGTKEVSAVGASGTMAESSEQTNAPDDITEEAGETPEDDANAKHIRLQRATALGLMSKGKQRGVGKWSNIVKAATKPKAPTDD